MISINESVTYTSTTVKSLNTPFDHYGGVILNTIDQKNNQIGTKNGFRTKDKTNCNSFNNVENKHYDSSIYNINKNNAKALQLRTNKLNLFNTSNTLKTDSTKLPNSVINLVSNVENSVSGLPILNSSTDNSFNMFNSDNNNSSNEKQMLLNNVATNNNFAGSLKFNELPFEQFYDVGEQLGRYIFFMII